MKEFLILRNITDVYVHRSLETVYNHQCCQVLQRRSISLIRNRCIGICSNSVSAGEAPIKLHSIAMTLELVNSPLFSDVP